MITENKNNLSAADFQKIGFSRPMSLTLINMADGNEHSSFDLESATSLRQPEISLCLRSLMKEGFAKYREVKETEGKGRPIKYFKLTVPVTDIVSKKVNEIESEMKSVLQTAKELMIACEN